MLFFAVVSEKRWPSPLPAEPDIQPDPPRAQSSEAKDSASKLD